MMSSLSTGSFIGIIGGGQLGRMLAMAAARLGYRTIVLEPQADCPAAQTANRHIAAAYDDRDALAMLAHECAVVTYEFENVPINAARALAEEICVFPPPRALEVSQDRLVEKTAFNDMGIATAGFRAVDSDTALAAALRAFGGNGVLKTRRLGYDGKGQRVIRNAFDKDVNGIFAAMGSVPLILETFVTFEREISVIAARNPAGEVAVYDAAQNVHRNGILHSSTVPARVSEATLATAKNAVLRLIDGLDYVGVIGVEFFVLPDGSLVANEFAPRVHNSGHWTEAACAVSQFEQHIRAIAGLPLGNGARHCDCIMENLIGSDIEHAGALYAQPNIVMHIYGKTQARPGRKMGHFTKLIG